MNILRYILVMLFLTIMLLGESISTFFTELWWSAKFEWRNNNG